ncbi:MAG: hypothetical protein RSC04_06540 [Bacteroidales bacterium]
MESILASSLDVVAKQKNVKNSLYAGIGIALGLVCILGASFGGVDNKAALYLALMTFGIIFVLVGVVMLIFNRGQWIYVPTKSEIKSYEIFFKSDSLHSLMQALETGNIMSLYPMKGESGQGVRLNALLSKDGKFAACQVYKYVPYNYEPASEIYTIKDPVASEFCECVKKINKDQ